MIRAFGILVGSLTFALTCGPAPGASADLGQFVRTESGRVRCAVGGDDPHGGGSVVVCEAGGLPPDAPPDQIGFAQAPTDPPANCPPPPGTYLRCVPTPIHWDLAVVHASGAFRWQEGNIGGVSPFAQTDTTLNYGQPSSDSTTFTNDATGHGMFVSIQDVHSF
jgi:hypothetical protein